MTSSSPVNNQRIVLGGGGIKLGGGGLGLNNKSLVPASSLNSGSLVPMSNDTHPNTVAQIGNIIQQSSSTAVMSYSQEHMKLSQKMGLLSVEDDVERRKQTTALIKGLLKQFQENTQLIQNSVKDFYNEARDADRDHSEFAKAKLKKLKEGNHITEQDMLDVDASAQLTKSVKDQRFLTSTQLMDLEKISAERDLTQYATLITMDFDARMKGINMLKERLELMRKQEIHEIDMETKKLDQALRERAQAVDLLLQGVKVQGEEKQKEFESHLKERQERYHQHNKVKKLQLEEKKINGEKELQELKIKTEQETMGKKLDYEKDIEKTRIAAQTTVELTKVISNIKPTPTCCIS